MRSRLLGAIVAGCLALAGSGCAADLGEVEWSLDPAFPPPGPADTELHLLVVELDCASGEPMGDRLVGPEVEETDDSVRIGLAVERRSGSAKCPSNPATAVTVELDAPLGDREITDLDGVPVSDTPVSEPILMPDGSTIVPVVG